jgi:acyl dehydratase
MAEQTPAPVPVYLEDLSVGQKFVSGTYEMTPEKIKTFAREYDPQPFHLDEAAAETSVFKGLAASGWHTAAVAMKLMAEGGIPFANGLVGFGGEFHWPRATRPGDILHLESEVLEITPSRSKPMQGVVTMRITALNQHSEPCYVLTVKILCHRRPIVGAPVE